MIPLIEHPKLPADSAIAVENIQLPDSPAIPNIGVHQSPNVTVASNGQGIHSGIGTGSHGGDGPGNGPGYGPGSDGGFGGNVYSLGGGVTAPVPIVTPEAEFSDEARRNKYQGLCLISLIVDAHGNPQNPRVIRALGMGLDEKALDAIRRYKFKPGTKDGKPVAVVMTIEVDFRLF
jgi:TonB family protein